MIGLQSGKVTLLEYQSDWPVEYLNEKIELSRLIGTMVLDIQHVGSTSIISCCAKPIIDIAIAISKLTEADKIIVKLTENGYGYHGDAGIPGRHFFTKGEKDNRTHYIHVEEINGELWNNHILFRDYLNQHNEYIEEYNSLKKLLAIQYPDDREKYTENKSLFITRIIKMAEEKINLGIRLTNASSG